MTSKLVWHNITYSFSTVIRENNQLTWGTPSVILHLPQTFLLPLAFFSFYTITGWALSIPNFLIAGKTNSTQDKQKKCFDQGGVVGNGIHWLRPLLCSQSSLSRSFWTRRCYLGCQNLGRSPHVSQGATYSTTLVFQLSLSSDKVDILRLS